MKFAIIRTGGKQYFVKESDEIIVDNINSKDGNVEFETLAEGDLEKKNIELGKPLLKNSVKGKIIENVKGDKIRVARYKSKVRYRKVKGFRPSLSKIKIVTI